MPVLIVENLSAGRADTPILEGVSWSVKAGEILGLVGESGAGKSMSLMSIVDLLPRGFHKTGSIIFAGRDISHLPDEEMCKIRGAEIGVIFQEPMTALNPVHTIGRQVAETARLHNNLSKKAALALAAATLARVGLSAHEAGLNRYPHQLSGGQLQRVAIAMAIIMRPKVILADEPTTALDVMTQKTVLKLLAKLAREDQCALVLVTHDLPLVAEYADRIAIMKDGGVVEICEGDICDGNLHHPYSKALLEAVSYRPEPARAVPQDVVMTVENLVVDYRRKERLIGPTRIFHAVKNVSFEIRAGETLALVGESGCGKSTLSRAIMGLQDITSGRVRLGEDLFAGASVTLKGEPMRQLRRQIQIVFQDPYGSFNPRHKIGRIISEPFHLLGEKMSKKQSAARVSELLESVRLTPKDAHKYPHQLSGGQRQRVAIARALATNPDVIILDEAVSSLDVSVRAQILDLLAKLRDDMKLAYLFVSHDLSLVEGFAERVLVMKAGEIVESGNTEDIFASPQHPYTKTLLAMASKMDI